MSHEPQNESKMAAGWEPCPSGEFEQLSQRLRQRLKRRRFLRASLAAAAAFVGLGGGLALYQTRTRQPPSPILPEEETDMDIAGIKCSQVRQVATAYIRGDLDEPTRQRVTAHIARCPNCNRLINSMRTAS